MEEKNKIYIASDFARYHSGTMPADEMHALEKAALEDPFIADALEGYMHAPAFESDIAELRDRLTEKRKKKNVFSLSSFAGNPWWRIAALFILMAGAGYFFYRVNDVNKENSLAKNEIKTPAESKESDPGKKDAVTPNNNVASQNQQASTFEQKGKTLPQSKSKIEKETFVAAQKARSPAVPSSVSRSKDGSYADSEYVLKGKVMDEEGNAVPFASVTDKTRNTETVTDTAGHFFLRSQDSSITAIVSATGYESKSFRLKKDKQPTIEINKKDADLNEAVVTSKAKRSQVSESDSELKALNGRASGVQITTAGPQPSGGKVKFDQYLAENIVPVYDGKGERLKGEVLLSFTINKKGRPEKIKVVKSSCAACTKEATRLLKNGPDWTGKKDIPGTVVIKF